ncbi:MAG: ATP-binding protein [Treponema sp.]|nr:ATP-binding protein [Treponema sp.]
MATYSKESVLFALKNWVRRYRITIINASVTVVLIATVISVLLVRSSSLQRKTAEESMINLAGMTSYEIQSYYQTYFNVARTLARIMTTYESVDVNQRGNYLSELMLSILSSNRSLVSVYTVWNSGVLFDNGSDYAAGDESVAQDQFCSGFTRERGWIEQRPFNEYRYLLDVRYRDLNLLNGMIGEPVLSKSGLTGTWIVDIQVPILGENEVLGVIGLTLNLDQLQFMVEPIRPYNAGNTMVVSSNGTIFAHNNARLRGSNFLQPGDRDPLLASGISSRVYQTVQQSLLDQQPSVLRTKDTLVVSYPLKNINPLSGSFSYNDSGDAHWAVVTSVPMAIILGPINTLLRFSLLFIAGAGILAAVVVLITSSSLTRQADVLQRDLERSTTMQDNLKYGLFLMDQKCVIQGAYSRALEKILSVSDLQGKVFTDLLSSSLKRNEKEGLQDYIEMIFKRSFDKEMLDDINPIDMFMYISSETGETKNLRTSFTLADRARGVPYILVTLEDITTEKKLERQLLDAENQKDKEMRSLFQVIQLHPRVLSDFIGDTEYEFDKINDLLKNKTHFHREVLMEIYQSIHAIKSNALILNLDNFSNRLHKLETTIKGLQEKYEDFVPFDDFLGLVLELEEAMKDKDQLKAAISKIQNFKTLSGDDSNQERYVLVETLTQACQKTGNLLNKKARFVVEDINDVVLEYGPRRVIKEILTQLVRNAIYHGIETPEERASLGKEIEGEVKLSIRYEGKQIIIKLSDNGRGIDFDRVRQTAESFNLLGAPVAGDDKGNLLQLLFSPGFSTMETADVLAGRGIGLSLVKDRVRELKGNIKVSTVKAKGTTFTLFIPLELPAAARAS